PSLRVSTYFLFKHTATTALSTLSLHDALPICIGTGPATTDIITGTLTSLGFKTHVSLVDQSVLYSKYCGVPKQEIDVCPTVGWIDRKSTRLNSSHRTISYAVFCLKKKKKKKKK